MSSATRQPPPDAPSGVSDSELRQRLAELRRTPNLESDAFDANLRSALQQAGEPDAPPLLAAVREWFSGRPWTMGAVTGAAATAALIFVYQGLTHSKDSSTALSADDVPALQTSAQQASSTSSDRDAPSGEETLDATTLPKNKVALIRFEFRSEVSIEDAEFHIELPEGLVFWSEGRALADASFSWTGALQQGNNTVVTAVRASREGRYRVLATAWVDGEPLIHEVILHVVPSEENGAS